MSKKKIGIIIVVVILVIAAAAGAVWYFLGGGISLGGNGDKVYVESVASLTSTNSGVQNRYSGVVEPQKTWDVKKDQEKTIKELFVNEGDEVAEGTPLFEYDMTSVNNEIAEAKLELEGIKNEIADYYSQIETLQSERDAASEDMKFQYTTEIQSIQTSIKQAEYNKESKAAEIANKEKSLDNAIVTSEIAGVIKSISENGYDQYTGEELPFISVLATGDYRVKGTINEQNIWTINVGSQVLLRSRVDETQTWTGTITEVDTNSEVKNNNDYYYDSGSSETATKYPFYIALDNAEGLILGQHVYIEMDMSQAETKEGVWLYESYIVMEEAGNYVWADNGRQKLEKRTVELGEYDEALGMYQIASGLTNEDYIAYPMGSMYEGVTTVTDASEVDYTSPMYMDENSDMEDGMMPEDGELLEDDMMLEDGEMLEDDMMLEDGEMPEDDMMLEDGEMPEDDMLLEDGEMPEGEALEDGSIEEGATEEEIVEPEVSE